MDGQAGTYHSDFTLNTSVQWADAIASYKGVPIPIPPLLGRHLEPASIFSGTGLLRMHHPRYPRRQSCTRRYVCEPIAGSRLVRARRVIPSHVVRELITQK